MKRFIIGSQKTKNWEINKIKTKYKNKEALEEKINILLVTWLWFVLSK